MPGDVCEGCKKPIEAGQAHTRWVINLTGVTSGLWHMGHRPGFLTLPRGQREEFTTGELPPPSRSAPPSA